VRANIGKEQVYLFCLYHTMKAWNLYTAYFRQDFPAFVRRHGKRDTISQ
jgi:hypothetical protein